MRSLRYMPLTFLIGVNGFPLFVYYVLIVAALVQVWRCVRPRVQTI